MLKLAMLKCFCLKKKILVLSDFAPQAVSSVKNCVLRLGPKQPDARPPTYLKVKAALPPDSRVRATFFFCSKTPFW